MRSLCTATLALALGAAVPAAYGEPLVTKGVGLSNCGKLVNDMKPSEGSTTCPTPCCFIGSRAT
jgi:hypothetical protein